MCRKQICAGLCEDYAFYGTQYSSECWCGSATDYDRYGDGVCDMPCDGNTSEICGGNFAISIYSNDGASPVDPTDPVDPVEPPTDPAYLGCFTDSEEGAGRVFIEASSTQPMTNEVRDYVRCVLRWL